MHIRSLRYMATLVLSGAILTILVGLASVWFLRSLGDLLGSLAPVLGLNGSTAEMITEIFGQLKDAEMNLPLECTGVACFLFCALAILFLAGRKKDSVPGTDEPVPKKKTGRIALVCVLAVVLFLPLVLVTIWFTEVNEIRFDRVIQSLIPVLQSGVL